MPRSIYFDYNATTPPDPAVREAMVPFFSDFWGNPSSVHHIGRRARALLDDARDRTAKMLGAKPSEIVFTSGGTEANNLAVFGSARLLKSKGKHLITSSIEHPAVLQCFDYLEKNEGFIVSRLPVNGEGLISVADFSKAVRSDTVFASVMAANNEIGTLQPVSEIGALCRERGIIFHTDAVQWFGKEPVENIGQFNADLVSVCAHKFHGPKGAGLLFIKSPLHPAPVLFGGGHENERRAGTENLPAIIGLVTALEKFIDPPVFDRTKLKPLVEKLTVCVKQIPGCELFMTNRLAGPLPMNLTAAGAPPHPALSPGGGEGGVSPGEGVQGFKARTWVGRILSPPCLANTVAFTVRGSDGIALMAGLDLEGICASSGSACSAGSLEPSHVVLALGRREEANSLVRFSLGRDSTMEEVDFVCSVLPEVIRRAQRSK
jgi:cysteine desulfurase